MIRRQKQLKSTNIKSIDGEDGEKFQIKKTQLKNSNVLSFGQEEEEGEVFQIKRTKPSDRVPKFRSTKTKLPTETEQPKASSYHTSSAGEYTQEKLEMLKKSTPAPPTPKPKEEEEIVEIVCPEDKEEELEEEFNYAIPDEEMIAKAKAQRGKYRQMGDFIPIKKDGDKMQVEEDIKFDIKRELKKSIQTQKIFQESEQKGDEDEDEYVHWEKQQTQKGRMGSKKLNYTDYLLTSEDKGQKQLKNINLTNFSSTSQGNSVGDILNLINEHKQKLVQSNQQRNIELQSLEYKIEGEVREISQLQRDMNELSSQYQFYQECKDYVNDLMSCFEFNLHFVEKLEEKYYRLCREFSERYFEEKKHFLIMNELEIRGRDNEAKNYHIGKVDELGRDFGGYYARKRNLFPLMKKKTIHNRYQGDYDEIEYDSEDEEDEELDDNNEKSEFIEKLNDLRIEADELFSENFPSIEEISQFFINWKKKDFNSYDRAFCDASLPEIYTPIVRIHLISWFPLISYPLLLTSQYIESDVEMADYHANDDNDNDNDHYKKQKIANLKWVEKLSAESINKLALLKLMENLIIPKLKDEIKVFFNVYSKFQNRKLQQIITDLKQFFSQYNKQSALVDTLLIDVLAKFNQSFKLIQLTSPFQSQFGTNIVRGEQVERAMETFWYHFKVINNYISWLAIIPESNLLRNINLFFNNHIFPFLLTFSDVPLLLHTVQLILEKVPKIKEYESIRDNISRILESAIEKSNNTSLHRACLNLIETFDKETSLRLKDRLKM